MTTSRQIDDIPKEKNRIKIAIVEDHTLLRESLIKSLNEAFDIQVVFDASNGVEFFELLKKKKINIALVDLDMPEMDGKELAEMIKSLSPTTPVLMLTGWGKQMSLNNEEVPQVDMIMAKPPKPAELESALRKLCRK